MIKLKDLSELRTVTVEEGKVVVEKPDVEFPEDSYTPLHRLHVPRPRTYNACYLELRGEIMVAHMGYRYPKDGMSTRKTIFEYGPDKFEFPLNGMGKRKRNLFVRANLMRRGIHALIFSEPTGNSHFIIGHSFPGSEFDQIQ